MNHLRLRKEDRIEVVAAFGAPRNACGGRGAARQSWGQRIAVATLAAPALSRCFGIPFSECLYLSE